MNDISPLSGPSAPPLVGPSASIRSSSEVHTPSRTGDSAEISRVAQLLSKLADLDVRQDKIDAVRAQIQAGTYLNDEKIEAAIDELISDFA